MGVERAGAAGRPGGWRRFGADCCKRPNGEAKRGLMSGKNSSTATASILRPSASAPIDGAAVGESEAGRLGTEGDVRASLEGLPVVSVSWPHPTRMGVRGSIMRRLGIISRRRHPSRCIRRSELRGVFRSPLVRRWMNRSAGRNCAIAGAVHAALFFLSLGIVVSLRNELGQPPEAGQRFVHLGLRIGWDVAAAGASEHRGFARRIDE